MSVVRIIQYASVQRLKLDLPMLQAELLPKDFPEPGIAVIFEHLNNDEYRYLDLSLSPVVLAAPDNSCVILGQSFFFQECKNRLDQKRKIVRQFISAWDSFFTRVDFSLRCRSKVISLTGRPLIMGILNVTPDSFSDGGKFIDLDLALQHAYKMVEEGADIIDIGGESSRPGATAVDKNDELARVIPLIQALSSNLDIPLSIDTCKSDVAEAAINAGADIVNDISALSADEGMADVISRLGVPAVLMHMKGTPGTMQSNPHYDDMLGEIFASLQSSIDYAISVGVERNQLIIDPGIGFGKLIPDNFVLLRRLKEFSAIGCPILVGASRKSFIGWALNKPETQRLSGSLAAAVAATLAGAHILRVHDVAASREAVEIAWQIKKSQQVNAGNEQWI